MAHFFKLPIQHINKETNNAVSISFAIPSHLKDELSFKSGQYITLKAIIDDNEVRRDYSLCEAPNQNELKVVVKAVKDGVFSVFANTKLKVGDELEISKPNGRFTFSPNKTTKRTIVAFAAGSGITPIMSILKTCLRDEPNTKFILVYGNKTIDDTIFHNDLTTLCKQNEHLDLHFMYSQTSVDNCLNGHIDASTVNYIIKNKYKNLTADVFYLCGPEAMINTVKNTLLDNSVDETTIYYELFTSSFKTSAKQTSQNNSNGETNITIILDDEEHKFTMSQKNTILDAAISKKIDPPYSCQGGICSSCIAKITEGAATMRQNNILTDSELEEGLVLTCQAQPTTASICVDFDDV